MEQRTETNQDVMHRSPANNPSGKVGFLTPWNQSCGLATYGKFLVTELRAIGLDVTVLSERGQPVVSPDEPFVVRCWERASSPQGPGDYSQLMQEIELRGITTLHINCQARFFSAQPFAQALALLRARGVRIVAQVHSLFTLAEELSALLGCADRILVHAPENRLEAIANGASPEAVLVVPHGVHTRPAAEAESAKAIRAALGIPEGEPLLITFGFVQPHKGLESLVEAVCHLRQRGIPAHGIIVGETRPDDPNSAAYLRALRELVNRSGVTEHVSFMTTFVPDEKVGEYLAAADVVIMNYRSQHYEASGACSLAVGAGAAVITSLAPAMMAFGDAVWHATSGYPVALSAELILTNPVLRRELRARARAYAQRHSWACIAQTVAELYDELKTASPAAVHAGASQPSKEKPVKDARQAKPRRVTRVLVQNRPNTFSQRGGDTVVLERISQGLAVRGIEVTVDVEAVRDPKDFDLVHLFNFATPHLTEALARRAQAAGVPFVVTTLYEEVPEFHNQSHALASALISYVQGGQDREWWRASKPSAHGVQPARRLPADWLAQNAAALFANGAGEARALRRDFPAAAPVIEIPVGHETGPRSDASLFEKAHGVRDFVLCVGRLETRKNQLMLLKALEDSDLTVVLAAGGFSYQPEYEQAVRAFRRRGKTIILDRLSPEMLSSAYAACRLHALPSWYELPGLVSLEAAAHGKNIVVTRTGTSADYVGDRAFYCAPSDEDSIFSAVLAAYHSPARQGLVEMASSFSWERTVDETVRAYGEILREDQIPAVLPPAARASAAPPASYGFYDMSVNAMELEDALAQGEGAARSMDFGRAEELFHKAEAMDPSSVRAIKGRAAVLLAQSKISEAQPLFDRALELAPKDAKVLAGRAMCESMSGRPELAVPYLERALAEAPDNLVALYQTIECAYRLSRFQEAERALVRYLELHPGDSEMRFCLAGCLYKKGDLATSLSHTMQVLSAKPDHEGGLELRVRLQAEIAAQDAARAAAVPSPGAYPIEAHSITPEGLDELSRLIQQWTVGAPGIVPAEAVAASGAATAPPVATEEPRAALDVDAKIADIEALKRSGKLTAAKERLDEVSAVRELSAEQREVVLCLQAEFKVIMGELEEAARLYDRLLDRNPHLARALCGKGALAAEAQQWGTAQAFFEASLDCEDAYDVALAGLGLCKMVANKPEEAFNLFRQAATINPENHRAILGVLQLGYPLKRYKEMESLVLAYLKRYPSNLDMLYSFAGLLYAQGKMREARSEVEKILIVEPRHESALELRELLDKVSSEPTTIM